MKKFDTKGQKGFVHTIAVMVMVTVVGIMSFLLLTSLGPFENDFLTTLYPKNKSNAQVLPATLASNQSVNVLSISYFPLDSTSTRLDANITGMGDDLTSIRNKVSTLTQQGLQSLTDGTKYHGYKSSTPPALQYNLLESKEFLEALPPSNIGNPVQPDYTSILNRINICDYVDNKNVKQVWLWGYHTTKIAPVESDMSMGRISQQYWNFSTYGDVSNSSRLDDMPICNKTYVLYNYNYGRGLGELLEDHGHQIEAVFSFIDNDLWQKYDVPHGLTDGTINHCGWTHSPPNVTDAEQYNWSSERSVISDCEDWKPEGGGQTKLVSCHTWYGGTCLDNGGVQFKIWWMQNIPGFANNLPYQTTVLRSWWELYGDFDLGLQGGKRLTQDVIVPTPSPGSLIITYPQADETFNAGDRITIKWISNTLPDTTCRLDYLTDATGSVTIADITMASGSYNWTIPYLSYFAPKINSRLFLSCPSHPNSFLSNRFYITSTTATPPPVTPSPFPSSQPFPQGSAPHSIPGTIQAEDFDLGGEGVGFHDLDQSNSGGAYRLTEGVDIEGTGDVGGGYNLAFVQAGEWLKYSINVVSSGNYTLSARVASAGSGGTFHGEIDGVNVTGTMNILNTNGWQTYQTVTSPTFNIGIGSRNLRLVMDGNAPSGYVGNFNSIALNPFIVSTPTPTPTPTPTIAPTAIPSSVPIPGDIDGNRKVDIFDYNILVTNFGKSGSGIQGDLDNNSIVNIFDYNILVTNFGH